MTNDLVNVDGEVAYLVPNLETGEVVDLLAQPEVIPDVLAAIRERQEDLKRWSREVTDAVVELSRLRGTKTLDLGGRKVSLSGGNEISWDMTVLWELLEAGLPSERFNDLVAEEVSYKVNAAVAKSIAASNPTYKAILDRARTDLEKRPSVKL